MPRLDAREAVEQGADLGERRAQPLRQEIRVAAVGRIQRLAAQPLPEQPCGVGRGGAGLVQARADGVEIHGAAAVYATGPGATPSACPLRFDGIWEKKPK